MNETLKSIKKFSTGLTGFLIDQTSLVLVVLLMCAGMLINMMMLFARVLSPVIVARFPFSENTAIVLSSLIGLLMGLGIETSALQFALRDKKVMSYAASAASGMLSLLGMMNSLSPKFAFATLSNISLVGVFAFIGFLPPFLLVCYSHLLHEELSTYHSVQHGKTIIEILRETNYAQMINFIVQTSPDDSAQRAMNAPPSPASGRAGRIASYRPTFN